MRLDLVRHRHPVRHPEAVGQPVLLTAVPYEGMAAAFTFSRRHRVTPAGDAIRDFSDRSQRADDEGGQVVTDGLLREAAALLRRRAAGATEFPEERWMVDQDETGALVLSVFTPEDVDPDGTVGGSILASFAYPDSPERHTHARALGAAAHMAALDPQTAVALAAWLETTASFEDRAEELADVEGAAPLVEPATRFARAYLRTAAPDLG
ncbi:hypothetical protein [Streptomyces sp. NPDC058247]|uniref:hypothetical protein n=1 Tax=Streptomyces sp. NPDC058247 TaxID=3346401 RepID=UPI0036EA3828